jgi:propionyl-CoA carboxylase beta chain
VVDAGTFMELRPGLGQSIVTGLARVDGWSVGVIAFDGAHDAGRLDSHGAEKIVRLLTLCDGFDLPVVSFIDSAGIATASAPEQERLMPRVVRVAQAVALSSCPTMTVVTGAMHGQLFASAHRSGWARAGIFAWPTSRLAGSERPTTAVLEGVYEAAGVLGIDEIVEPARTREVLAAQLGRLAHRHPTPLSERVLRYWSTC